MNENVTEQLLKDAVPSKTKASTDWGIKAWTEWARARVCCSTELETRAPPTKPLLQIPPEDFAFWLTKFILEARNQSFAPLYRARSDFYREFNSIPSLE